MAFEIERKYLVADPSIVDRTVLPPSAMRQAYLSTGAVSVRVRIANGRARLTVKGPTHGIRRAEYEYEIPLGDAEEMMKSLRQGEIIEKTRYERAEGGLVWEIDVFGGANAPLMVAEVELDDEDAEVTKPTWVGEEVSGDQRFGNASLALNPYSGWGHTE